MRHEALQYIQEQSETPITESDAELIAMAIAAAQGEDVETFLSRIDRFLEWGEQIKQFCLEVEKWNGNAKPRKSFHANKNPKKRRQRSGRENH